MNGPVPTAVVVPQVALFKLAVDIMRTRPEVQSWYGNIGRGLSSASEMVYVSRTLTLVTHSAAVVTFIAPCHATAGNEPFGPAP